MSQITLSGFPSYSGLNGTYTSDGAHDGYTRYVNDTDANIVVEYKTEYGPYSFAPFYYIIKTTGTEGAIPIEKPLYQNSSTDPEAGVWVDMQ